MLLFFFFSSRRRHTRFDCDWSQTCALPIFRPLLGRHHTRARVWSAVTGGAPEINPVDGPAPTPAPQVAPDQRDRKSTRLNSSHSQISYAVFCLKKKKKTRHHTHLRSDKISNSIYR